MKIRKKTFFSLSIIIMLFALLYAGCKPQTVDPEEDKANISFVFHHYVDGNPVKYDTLMYVNEAGNEYMINEIQYFISDVKLYHEDGSVILLDEWDDIYYVDVDIPSTLTWKVFDDLPVGNYSSISFTFGINEVKNQSFMYVNPPERDMFWPTFLGGGYHYMKINGKWKAKPSNMITPIDFHLGIGQIYAGDVIVVDSITAFVQNYFDVSLASSSFSLAKDEVKEIHLRMDIEEWFKNPNTINFDSVGGYIMQNQDAMGRAKENGHNVFSIQTIQ
jgi:hypothetical protein